MAESNTAGYRRDAPYCTAAQRILAYRATPRNAIIARSTSTTCSAVSRPSRARITGRLRRLSGCASTAHPTACWTWEQQLRNSWHQTGHPEQSPRDAVWSRTRPQLRSRSPLYSLLVHGVEMASMKSWSSVLSSARATKSLGSNVRHPDLQRPQAPLPHPAVGTRRPFPSLPYQCVTCNAESRQPDSQIGRASKQHPRCGSVRRFA